MLNRRHLFLGAIAASVATPAVAQEKRRAADARKRFFSPSGYVGDTLRSVRDITPEQTSDLLIVDRFGVGTLNTFTSMSEFESAPGAENAHAEARSSLRLFFENGGRRALALNVDPDSAAGILGAAGGGGLRGIADIPALYIDFVAAPCAARLPVKAAAKVYREALKLAIEQKAMLLIDPPPGEARASKLISGWFDRLGLSHPDTAFYAPRLTAPETEETIAPSGAVAGIIARTDAARGVWKAPAGTEAALLGAAPSQSFSKTDSDLLAQHNVNPIRNFTGRGPIVWGARTGSSDPEWKYVPVRRFFLFLEESINDGLEWAVFEPNGEPLWAEIRRHVEAFLNNYYRQRAMAGAKPEDAFFVRCDRTTMTQNDIDNGILKVTVGFAPLKPAEFVIFNVRLKLMKS